MSSVGARELDLDRYSETGWVRILGDAGGFDASTLILHGVDLVG